MIGKQNGVEGLNPFYKLYSKSEPKLIGGCWEATWKVGRPYYITLNSSAYQFAFRLSLK